jgi:hypothetical protein
MRTLPAVLALVLMNASAARAEEPSAPVEELHSNHAEYPGDGEQLLLFHPGLSDHPLTVTVSTIGSGRYLRVRPTRLPHGADDAKCSKALVFCEIEGNVKVRLSSRLVALEPNGSLPLYLRSVDDEWEKVSNPTAEEIKALKPKGADAVFVSRKPEKDRVLLFSDSSRSNDGTLCRETFLLREADDWYVSVRASLLLPDKRLIVREGRSPLDGLRKRCRDELTSAFDKRRALLIAGTAHAVCFSPSPESGVVALSTDWLYYSLALAIWGRSIEDDFEVKVNKLMKTSDSGSRATDRLRDGLTLACRIVDRNKSVHPRGGYSYLRKLGKELDGILRPLGSHVLELPLVWANEPWLGFYQRTANRLRVLPGAIEWQDDPKSPSQHLAQLDKRSRLILNLRPRSSLRIAADDHERFRKMLARTETVGSAADAVRIEAGFPDFPKLEVASIPRHEERPKVLLCRLQGDSLQVVLVAERGRQSEELIRRLTGDGLKMKLTWNGRQFGFSEAEKSVSIPVEIKLRKRPTVITPPPKTLQIHVAAAPSLWSATAEKELRVVIRYRDGKGKTVVLKRDEASFEKVEFPMELTDDEQPIFRYRYFSPTRKKWLTTEDSVLVID